MEVSAELGRGLQAWMSLCLQQEKALKNPMNSSPIWDCSAVTGQASSHQSRTCTTPWCIFLCHVKKFAYALAWKKAASKQPVCEYILKRNHYGILPKWPPVDKRIASHFVWLLFSTCCQQWQWGCLLSCGPTAEGPPWERLCFSIRYRSLRPLQSTLITFISKWALSLACDF